MPSALPPWLKTRLPSGEAYERIKAVSARRRLATVCEEARCPNLAECWGGGTATFMVMGDTCTRGCRFCSVGTAVRPGALDPDEPAHLAETLAEMGLDYTVITTVCRDDLADQGAGHLAEVVRQIKTRNRALKLELLIQDFRGDVSLLRTVLDAGPDVLAHNIETVERLSPKVRDARASYAQSLKVLRSSKEISPKVPTKSSLMLGLGETESEVMEALRDLRKAGVDIVTIGQYLRPSSLRRHLPVAAYIHPDRFAQLEKLARGLGFLYVASGPFVRSSYRAGELFIKGLLEERNATHHG